ncbi:MAG: hypothetical protein K2J80_03885, partial [Oscillospiraceae bacterium]|nr:hypothetical protein [Oscillospiraceae bacterium]
MKKIIAAITLGCLVLTLTACEKTEVPNNSNINSVPTSNKSSVNSSANPNVSTPVSSSSTNMISAPIESIPNLPTSDDPETVSGRPALSTGHDLSTPTVPAPS